MTRWAIACIFGFWAQGSASADIYFLGEVHDNPAHHAEQARRLSEIVPRALVWEMLPPALAGQVTPDTVSDADILREALDWDTLGWPDFKHYYPIFAAAPTAATYGAGVPRDTARLAMSDVAGAFSGDPDEFGLTRPLDAATQAAREALQMRAHCDALPTHLLPMMVDVQRLRDAELARAALLAWQDTGGPVVVITGNGHARRDWGAPAILSGAAPDLVIFSLGQGEVIDGESQPPMGSFDELVFAPAPSRADPCEGFAAGGN